jgi:hypothetical protein
VPDFIFGRQAPMTAAKFFITYRFAIADTDWVSQDHRPCEKVSP